MRVIIYPLNQSDNLFPVDPIEAYKFYLRTRLPKKAMRQWLDSLSESDREKIANFQAGIAKTVRQVSSELGINGANAFSSVGFDIVSGAANGVKG